jgi:predicted flap endonuclease-1-like 5' DNA nuclease
MAYCLYCYIRVSQTQNSLNFNIPLWVWILLGILLLAIILGLILGERMAEDGAFTQTNGRNLNQPVMIPQTGGEGHADPADLTLLHGIDQGTQQALNGAGITTFEQLAKANINDLRIIVFPLIGQTAVMVTWPDQAKMAAAGQWNELRDWQNKLSNNFTK